ncbi:MAG TPA: PAS domain S-box protein [Candidatus Nanoarchaeia archaeon]|nr:PAS domain S-box protein [Candidatus Nanoarchaeia archaeon]
MEDETKEYLEAFKKGNIEKNKLISTEALLNILEDLQSAQRQLKESERKYRLITENTSDYIFLTDLSLRIIYSSPSCSRMGYASEDLVGKSIADFMAPKDANRFSVLAAAYASERAGKPDIGRSEGRHKEFACMFTSKDKGWRVLDSAMILLSEDDGKGNAVMITARDVTEKRHAEKILKTTEEKYKTLYQSSRDAIMILEPPTWRFTAGNKATISMFRVKDEKEFTSKTLWQYSPKTQPDGKPSDIKAKSMIMKAAKEGVNFFEWTHQRANGNDFPATVLFTRIKLEDKDALQATVRDITAQKQAENMIKESEEKYRSLVETSPDCIKLFDTRKKIVFMNQGGFREHRLKNLEEAKKFDVIGSLIREDKKKMLDALDEALKGKTSTIVVRHNPKESVRKACLETLSPVRDANGRIYGVFGVSRDISSQKKVEQELSHYKNHLEELVKEKTRELEKQNIELVRSSIDLAETKKELEDKNIELQNALESFKKELKKSEREER